MNIIFLISPLIMILGGISCSDTTVMAPDSPQQSNFVDKKLDDEPKIPPLAHPEQNRIREFCGVDHGNIQTKSLAQLKAVIHQELVLVCKRPNSLDYCNSLRSCTGLFESEQSADRVNEKTVEFLCNTFIECLAKPVVGDVGGVLPPDDSPLDEDEGGGEEGVCGSSGTFLVGGFCLRSKDPICGAGENVCVDGDLKCLPVETSCSAREDSCSGVFNVAGLATDVVFGPTEEEIVFGGPTDGFYSSDSYFAIADYEATNISVLIQDNTLSRNSSYVDIPVPAGSYVLKTFDINQNGTKNDLLVVNIVTNAIYPFIYTNVFPTPASFTPLGALSTGNKPVAVDTGILNNDGLNDIVVVDQDDNTVSIFINDMGTGFLSRVVYAVGERPTDVVLADINGDSFLDIAVSNFTSQSISVLLNNGDGTFGPKTDYPAGARPTAIAAGDLNGSGVDLVVTNGGNAGDNTISVFLNDGVGNMGVQHVYDVGESPSDVIVVDFDNDTNLDVLTANLFDSDVSILLGDGTGHLSPANNYGQGLGASRLLATDYSYDGLLDILVVNPGANSSSFLYNNGTGGLSDAPYPYSILNSFQSGGYGVYDFNGDGIKDIITLDNRSGKIIFTPRETCQNGYAITSFIPQAFPTDYQVGDLDLDGDLDIVVLDFIHGIYLYYNDGTGNFSAQLIVVSTALGSVNLADVNFDGYLDILALSFADLYVYKSNNGTSFDAPELYPSGTFSLSLGVGDIDQVDGVDAFFIDIGMSPMSGYYKNDGMGNFGMFQPFSSVGTFPLSVQGIIDLNGDGAPEVILQEFGPTQYVIYFNDGAGNFNTGDVSILTGGAGVNLNIGDLNNDNKPDIVSYSSSGIISVYLNSGSGKFEDALLIDFPAPTDVSEMFLMDLDDNGFLDIIYYYSDFRFGAIYNPGQNI
jgi:hypothetical protein